MLVRLGRQRSIGLRHHVDPDDPAVHNDPADHDNDPADHDNDPADHDNDPADHHDCACPVASYPVRERGGGAHRRR
jgi:hypothetical protein